MLTNFCIIIPFFVLLTHIFEIFKNSFLINTPIEYPALLGDCPFNEMQLGSNIIFENFVFPISSELTLVHNRHIDKKRFENFFNTNESIHLSRFFDLFSTFRDLGTISLSNRIIVCSDKLYLEKMIEKYNKVKNKEQIKSSLSTCVFKILKDYENLDRYFEIM
jgi:hypothetical protein